MLTGTSRLHGAYEQVLAGSRAARPETAMFRRRSLQPTRRAVLHVQASGDPAAPDDLAGWFTERAFNFYVAGLRMPGRPARSGRAVLATGAASATALETACADLDSACAYLRDTDGIGHLIVTAQGRAALAAAIWSGARPDAADGLVLCEPELPSALDLSVACPVLVVRSAPARTVRQSLLGRRQAVVPQLGGHVTWLQLPPQSAGAAGRRTFFAELGRWLGAYMYAHDQLL